MKVIESGVSLDSLFIFLQSVLFFVRLTPHCSAKTMNTLEFMCARRLNKSLANRIANNAWNNWA